MKIRNFILLYALASLIAGFPLQTIGMETEYKTIYRHSYKSFPSDQYTHIAIKIPLILRENSSAHEYYSYYIAPSGPSNSAITYWWSAPLKSEANDKYKLGDIFFYGRGFKQDDEEAQFWLEKSAAQEHPRAMYLLGLLHLKYYEASGVKKDLGKATFWLSKSALQNNSLAQSKLYEIEKALVIPIDLVQAFFSNFFTEKKEALDESDIQNPPAPEIPCAVKGSDPRKEERKRYEESAAHDDREGHFMFGAYNHFGIGGPVDEEKALEHYDKANKKGHPLAKRTLKAVKKIPNFGSRQSRG